MRAKRIKGNVPYVLESDKELSQEEQTTFQIKAVPPTDNVRNLKIGAGGDEFEKTLSMDGEYLVKVVRLGLVGWSNFKDEDDSEIQFGLDASGKVKKDLLDLIGEQALIELGLAILNLSSGMSAEEVKNSNSQSS